MKHPVMIKGNKYGIILVLEKSMDFQELLQQIGETFKKNDKFFDSENQIAISFEGRDLTTAQQKEILSIISQNCQLQISYIIDIASSTEAQFKEILDSVKDDETEIMEEPVQQMSSTEQALLAANTTDGQFYKGTLRSGQSIDSESSIIVIGDVNPGATVTAKGNIIILGCLKGAAFAGSDGNEHTFVVALDMIPMQIRIGNVIARAPDQQRPKRGFLRRNLTNETEAKIAFVEDKNIYIEAINKNVLDDIRIGC